MGEAVAVCRRQLRRISCGTWQQFFLDKALDSWHEEQSLALSATDNGITLTPEAQIDLDNLRKELAASVSEGGYSSINAMLQHDMGAGCDFDDYYSYRYTYTDATGRGSGRS